MAEQRLRTLLRRSVVTRTLALGSVALLALTVAACGGGSGSASGSSSGAAENVTLDFWTHTDPPLVGVTQKLVDEYQKAHPNVKINYTQIPNAQFFTKMLTSMSTGSGPDVFDMNENYVRGDYIPRKLLAPIDPAAMGYKDNAALTAAYEPGALDGAKGPTGTIYGVPLEDDAAALAINTDLFKKAGLTAADYPKTWDDVGTVGAKIAQATGTQGFNFVYLPGWGLIQLSALMLQTGGNVVDASGKVVVDQPQSVAALNIWNKLVNVDHAGDAHTATRNSTDPYYDFGTGKQAMTMIFPWAVAQIQKQHPDTFSNMTVIPLPQADPSHPHGYNYGYSWNVSAHSSSAKQKASWSFVRFLADHHDDYLSQAGLVQPVKGWQGSDAGKQMPFSATWSKIYQKADFFQVSPNWSQVGSIMQTAIEATILNGQSAQQSLAQAAPQISQAVK